MAIFYGKSAVDSLLALKVSKSANLSDILDQAAARLNLGIVFEPYVWNATTPTTGTTAAWRVQSARTLSSARMRCVTAPVGSALTAQLQLSTNDGASFTTISTLTIAAGSTTEAVANNIGQALAVGNLLRLNVSGIGSTTPATQVVVEAHTS